MVLVIVAALTTVAVDRIGTASRAVEVQVPSAQTLVEVCVLVPTVATETEVTAEVMTVTTGLVATGTSVAPTTTTRTLANSHIQRLDTTILGGRLVHNPAGRKKSAGQGVSSSYLGKPGENLSMLSRRPCCAGQMRSKLKANSFLPYSGLSHHIATRHFANKSASL